MQRAIKPFIAPTLGRAGSASVRQDAVLEPQINTEKAFTIGKLQLLREARRLNLLLLMAVLGALTAVILIVGLMRSGDPNLSSDGILSLKELGSTFIGATTGLRFQAVRPAGR